jgi:hypothetical protein
MVHIKFQIYKDIFVLLKKSHFCLFVGLREILIYIYIFFFF